MDRVDELIEKLTTNEKAALVSGCDFVRTNSVPRLGIPSLCFADGPHGLRKQTGAQDNGSMTSEISTAFPTAAATASSWNMQNVEKMGEAIGRECLHYGVAVLLGPAVNIKRNPLAGRNFEYFSEDPLLAGKMGAAEVKGVQSKGVGVSVKHFALNNAENYRFMGDSIVDMRAAREIYLKTFEIIVKESLPRTLMCAYNKINGEYCCENKWLLSDLLRNEWGYNGLVMSDWGATHDRVKGITSGLDLEMPGGTAICRKWIIDGINSGALKSQDLDKAVTNVLRLVECYKDNPKGVTVDWEKHDRLSAEIAEDSAILLKNDGILPLNESEKLLVVGDLFEKMRYQGAGSSMINPYKVTTPRDAFYANGIECEFARGYAENQTLPQQELISSAVEKAKSYDKILVFAGLTDYVESEGCDRDNMRLPDNQLALIDALLETNKKVVVILFGGSPVELPFADKTSAILNMYLPGQNGGTATYNLLFGKKSPSGKLAETWVKSYADVPFNSEYSKSINELYKESVFVGYRYYLTANIVVRYPFGYGLSYTQFEYGDMTVKESKTGYDLSLTLTNVGSFDGAEVVQLYVEAPKTDIFKPERELRGFTKVYLKQGESRRVILSVSLDDMRYWNNKENRFVVEGGEYIFELCTDCQTVKLSQKVCVNGESAQSPYDDDISKIYKEVDFDKVTDGVFERMSGVKISSLPSDSIVTLESRFTAMRRSFMGRLLFRAVLSVPKYQMKKALKLSDGAEKDNAIKGAQFTKRILESNSLISMSMSAGKSFPYNFAEGFAHFANGKIIKGIKCFCTKIKAPILPKDKEE